MSKVISFMWFEKPQLSHYYGEVVANHLEGVTSYKCMESNSRD